MAPHALDSTIYGKHEEWKRDIIWLTNYNLAEWLHGGRRMYLKKLMIKNFRNFREQNNEIEFVNSTEIKKEDKTNVAAVTTLIVGKNNAGKTTIVNALDKLINTHSGSKIFGSKMQYEIYDWNIYQSIVK